VRLALALGERDPDSLDIYWGPSDWRDAARKAYRPLGDIRADAERLRARIAEGDRLHDERRQFLDAQVAALISRIDLLRGARPAFDDEARQLFGIDLASETSSPEDDARVSAAHAELDRILPGRGPLADRYRDLEAQFVVPPARVSAVFAAALSVCRSRTAVHIALPADEHIDVELQPSRSPWAAFTEYRGDHRSRLRINGAFAFTVDRLLDLACHEGYPGHHTAYTLQDDELVRARHLIELFVQPLFSPQSFLSEGAATYAPDLVFDERERIEVERATLIPKAGLQVAPINNDDGAGGGDALAAYVRASALVAELEPIELGIARRYLDGQMEFARAAAALTGRAVMADPMPVLKFLNEYRTYVVTYTAGRREVARIVERAADNDARWQTYRRLLILTSPVAQTPH